MDKIGRRGFIKLIGSGAIAAGALAPSMGLLSWTGKDVLTFRAVAGLPSGKLPSYASYVLEGSVNLTTRSGTVTKTVYAGSPETMSTVALPGLSRIVRITDVRDSGVELQIRGVIDDKSQLRSGESPTVDIRIDRAARVARAAFLGTEVLMRLQT